MMHSLPGIRFHTRVRYVSAGLNNLKSELSISVNCYTSVNVDLSMSLNCSFYYPGAILDMAYNYVLCTEIIKVRFLAGDYLRGVSLQTSGVTTTSACLAGSIPVLSTHFCIPNSKW